ncbi:MAG: DUF1501 domain-containing protein, partial [Burkholderiales bacterium]|nr:DUF1501 domain-containing protein [Burkholderiales bacterium]
MHKTGSTSIQHSLFRARSLRGAHYLHAGKPNSSPTLQTAFRDEPGRADYHRLLGSTPEAMEREAAEIRAALHERLATAVKAFYEDLAAGSNNLQEKVLSMTFSEFGRTIFENGSQG